MTQGLNGREFSNARLACEKGVISENAIALFSLRNRKGFEWEKKSNRY
jgi:hypothetical protein